jgi:hypothetical protein
MLCIFPVYQKWFQTKSYLRVRKWLRVLTCNHIKGIFLTPFKLLASPVHAVAMENAWKSSIITPATVMWDTMGLNASLVSSFPFFVSSYVMSQESLYLYGRNWLGQKWYQLGQTDTNHSEKWELVIRKSGFHNAVIFPEDFISQHEVSIHFTSVLEYYKE